MSGTVGTLGDAARLALLAVVLGIAGCNNIFGSRACTLIGCQDGLRVTLARVPAVPFRVEVRSTSNASTAYVYDCPDPVRCAPDIFFADFGGAQAFVTVATAAGSRTTTFEQIEYRVSRPNGADCPPECRQAAVTVDVP